MEYMWVFFIDCQNKSNLLIFSLLFAYIYGGEQDIVWGVLVNIAQSFGAFSKYRTYVSTCFCHYHLFA
jgi:hypothetical protein